MGTTEYRLDAALAYEVITTSSRALPSGVMRRLSARHTAYSMGGSGALLPSNIALDFGLYSDATGTDLQFLPMVVSPSSIPPPNPLVMPRMIWVPRDGLVWEGRYFIPPGTWAFARWYNADIYAHNVFASLVIET